MYAPHTVTVYFTGGEENHITVLTGVFYDGSRAAGTAAEGLTGTAGAALFIPFGVKAEDALTGRARRYAGPKQFAAAEDRSGLWSLGLGEQWFFVKGRVTEPAMNFQQIKARYEGVHRLVRVNERGFGSAEMRHFEAEGA